MAGSSRSGSAVGLSQADTTPPERRRRRLRWIPLALCIVISVWIGRFAYLRITRRPTPRPEYWAARIAELDPPGEGALSTEQAYEILNNRPWEGKPEVMDVFTWQGFWRTLEGQWDESRRDISAATLVFTSGEFHRARAELQRATRLGWPDITPPVPWPYMVVSDPHAGWGSLLLSHSRWSREQGEDIETTVEDWLTALRLARQARRQRTALSLRFESGIIFSVAIEMIWTAKEPHDHIDTRTLAIDVDQITGALLSPAGLLEGERLYLHSVLEHSYVRENGDWLAVNEFAANRMKCAGSGPATPPSSIWNLASPLFHDLPTARERVDEYIAACREIPDGVTAARLLSNADQDWNEHRVGVLDGLGENHYYLVENSLPRYRLARCLRDAALTMLALAEYYRQHRDYPETLDELVPDLLPRLPIDYADGRILRYRRVENNFVLYSIGEDGKDDGGTGIVSRPSLRCEPDFVFTLLERPPLYER
ncbi:MAG: hypothetical protein JXQ75_06580 [Phycisphaerae bacterium]|nr:hypothetical protein [Phycisphaerae bacterium]